MPKKHRNLIEQITAFENLQLAYEKTSKGKKSTFDYLMFREYDQANLRKIQRELIDGTYKIGDYRQFTVYEPKARLISALRFKDRLVQHALCNVIGPLFDQTFLPYSFACRSGLGTHAGVKHIQSEVRKHDFKYFLKTDYSKFFPSIDRAILHNIIERKIDCARTLEIIKEIIPESCRGLPIGSLTSQLFANVYGNEADKLIHHSMGHRSWARYMDDIVILGNDMNSLRDDFEIIRDWSNNVLQLRISKWQVSSINKGINFLGYRIWKGHKLLRKDSVTRAKQKIRKYQEVNDQERLNKFIASWSGHAQWADANNLFKWMENNYA